MQNDKLVEALEPFAAVADLYDDGDDDNHEVWVDRSGVGGVPREAFHLRNYRNAREALATLSRSDDGAGEAVAWLYNREDDFQLRKNRVRFLVEQDGWTETPLYAHPPAAVAAAVGDWLGPVPCDGKKPDWLPDDALCMIAYNPRESQNAMTWEFAEKRAKPVRDRDWDGATAFCFKPLAHPPVADAAVAGEDQLEQAECKGMDKAANFCIEALAKALDVDDWQQADGSETWDGDVAGTIYNVLKAARVYDDEDGRVARLDAALHPAPAEPVGLRETLLAKADEMQRHAEASFYPKACSEYRAKEAAFREAAVLSTLTRTDEASTDGEGV